MPCRRQPHAYVPSSALSARTPFNGEVQEGYDAASSRVIRNRGTGPPARSALLAKRLDQVRQVVRLDGVAREWRSACGCPQTSHAGSHAGVPPTPGCFGAAGFLESTHFRVLWRRRLPRALAALREALRSISQRVRVLWFCATDPRSVASNYSFRAADGRRHRSSQQLLRALRGVYDLAGACSEARTASCLSIAPALAACCLRSRLAGCSSSPQRITMISSSPGISVAACTRFLRHTLRAEAVVGTESARRIVAKRRQCGRRAGVARRAPRNGGGA